MSYTSNIWLYPLHDWWRAVNEMSNFMHSGEMGSFIFHPVSTRTISNSFIKNVLCGISTSSTYKC